jgi:YggT family protein
VSVVCTLIWAYSLVILARIILEYVPVSFDHPVAKVRSAFRAVTEPVLAPIRSILPPVRLGGVGLDLSPLVLLIGLNVLATVICR